LPESTDFNKPSELFYALFTKCDIVAVSCSKGVVTVFGQAVVRDRHVTMTLRAGHWLTTFLEIVVALDKPTGHESE